MNESDTANRSVNIETANRQPRAVDEQKLAGAARRVLEEEEVPSATVSLAIVDDPAIHALNRRYLQHDWATDVLSFVLDERAGHLDGEVIVSADTAAAAAVRFGWSLEDELLLYVIHGTLHLAGYDDTTPEARREMRARERHYLAHYGLAPRYDEADELSEADGAGNAPRGGLQGGQP